LKDVQIAEEEARESEASDRVQAQIPCNNGLYVCMYVCIHVCMYAHQFFFECLFFGGFFGSDCSPENVHMGSVCLSEQ